jgi:chromosome segregation ATPase
MGGDAQVELERLRADLEKYPTSLVDWEAACLRHMANLLDSLEQARSEWVTLSARLAEAEERLEDLRQERERLAQEAGERERQRRELAEARAALEGARHRTELLEAAHAARIESLEETTAELRAVRAELEEVKRERDVLAENARRSEDAQAELEEARRRVREIQRLREESEDKGRRLALTQDALVKARRDLEEASRDRQRLEEATRDGQAALARLAELEAEHQKVTSRAEKSMLEVCELRVLANRLEIEKDEAKAQRKEKHKRLLEKIHQDLDEAGAPKGDEWSFGARIRWLRERIDELGGRA